MSILNNNNKKGKKKAAPLTGKSGFLTPNVKSNSKAAAKNTRITGRSQRGS